MGLYIVKFGAIYTWIYSDTVSCSTGHSDGTAQDVMANGRCTGITTTVISCQWTQHQRGPKLS